MSDKLLLWIFAVLLILLNNLQSIESIRCMQCNRVVKGSNNNCDKPKYVEGCTACLKTFTKIVNHESWRNTRDSTFTSRLCIKKIATSRIKDAGCYYQTNNGGYTEQCFCYSDDCNSSGHRIVIQWRTLIIVPALIAVWLRCLNSLC